MKPYPMKVTRLMALGVCLLVLTWLITQSPAVPLAAESDDPRSDETPSGGLAQAFVYYDRDLDFGYFPEFDVPLEGWVVRLRDATGSQVGSDMLTGADGLALFSDLTPGAYAICHILQYPWTNYLPGDEDGAPLKGQNQEVCADILVADGATAESVFINYRSFRYGTVRVKVYHDLDKDGQYDVGEPGLSGWTLGWFLFHGYPDEVLVTDAQGEAVFSGEVDNPDATLNATICMQMLPYWINTDPGATIPCKGATVRADEEAFVFFGNKPEPPRGSVRASVYHDLNGDGQRGPDEPPLAGWMLFLSNKPNTTVGPELPTNAQGEAYWDDISPGPYLACQRLFRNWRNTDPGDQTAPEACVNIVVHSGQEASIRFGNAVYFARHLPFITR